MNEKKYNEWKKRLEPGQDFLNDAMVRDAGVRMVYPGNALYDQKPISLLQKIWDEFNQKIAELHKNIGFTDAIANQMFLYENRDSHQE